jgi:hypothetical protein
MPANPGKFFITNGSNNKQGWSAGWIRRPACVVIARRRGDVIRAAACVELGRRFAPRDDAT